MIYFPNIRIRSKGEKRSFPLSDGHHKLLIAEDGNIQFFHLQCSDGTGASGGYEFVGIKDHCFDMWGSPEIELLDHIGVINEIASHYGFYDTIDHANVIAVMQGAIHNANIRRETERQKMVIIARPEDETPEEIEWRKNLRTKRICRAEQSIIDLARQCNMSPSCYSDIEVGRKKPTEEQKKQIDIIVSTWGNKP